MLLKKQVSWRVGKWLFFFHFKRYPTWHNPAHLLPWYDHCSITLLLIQKTIFYYHFLKFLYFVHALFFIESKLIFCICLFFMFCYLEGSFSYCPSLNVCMFVCQLFPFLLKKMSCTSFIDTTIHLALLCLKCPKLKVFAHFLSSWIFYFGWHCIFWYNIMICSSPATRRNLEQKNHQFLKKITLLN